MKNDIGTTYFDNNMEDLP